MKITNRLPESPPLSTRWATIRPQARVAVLLGLTILIQLANPGVTDVSWLIVLGNKLLSGERLYIDVIETNPPASLLIYMPPIWVARQTGLQTELVVLSFVIAGLGAGLWFAGRLLARNGLLANPTGTAISATIAFGVAAGSSFAQREHIAIIALLPMLAAIACRTKAATKLSRFEALCIGIAAGVAVSIKPHFAAAILLPQLFAAWSTKSARPLLGIENWATGAVFTLYALSAFFLFPEFWSNVFPMLIETYRPARLPFWLLLIYVMPFLAVGGTYIYACTRGVLNSQNLVPLFAAAGFMAGYFEQGKGWSYHYYPAVALLLYVVLDDILATFAKERPDERKAKPYHAVRVTAAVTLCITALLRFMPYSQVSAPFEPSIRQIGEHPRILAITGDLGLSNPLTRRVNGIWVGSVVSQWLTETAYQILQRNPDLSHKERRRLERWVEKDRKILNKDISNGRPDVILLDTHSRYVDWKAWARADRETDRLLSNYVLKAKNKYVELYVRRNSNAAIAARMNDPHSGNRESSNAAFRQPTVKR